MAVQVLPVAEADITEAYARYEEMQAGLGVRFLEAIRVACMLVAENPESYRVLHKGIRRVLLHRFPYGLFYSIDRGRVVVFGCFHGRREPTAWKDRGGRRGES